MKSINLFLILITALGIISCTSSSDDKSDGGSSSDPTPSLSLDSCQAFSFARTKIANGEVCSVGNQNSPLVRLSIEGLGFTGVCTGTVIDRNTVLTAAHCLQGDIISVVVESTAGSFLSRNFFVPSSYDDSGDVGIDDIGIVKTSIDIPINPLPLLLSSDPIIGESAYIGGFGERSPGSIDSSPRAGEVIVAGLTSNSVIVRFQGDQAHPCEGDSGGPLVVDRNGQRAIVGVVSQSDPSVRLDNICRPGDITLYTSLTKSSVLSFINQLAPNAGAL